MLIARVLRMPREGEAGSVSLSPVLFLASPPS